MTGETPAVSRVSIPATVFATIDRLGDAEAAVSRNQRVTFSQLGERIQAMAASLIASGVSHGDRVAVWAPNSVDWVVVAVGLQSVGATLVPINTRYKATEAAPILARTKATTLFTVTGFLDIDPVQMLAVSDADLADLIDIVIIDGGTPDGTVSLSDFLSRGDDIDKAAVEARRAAVGPEDLCDIMFTSGTTGIAKGVMMNHGQTLEQFDAWCDFAGLREGDRYLIANPFFHMFGYKAGWLACLLRGATMFPMPVFDVEDALQVIEQERITMFPGAPTLYQMILDHGATASADLSSLRVAVTGAADIPVELIRRMHTELPFETIMTGYGLTEACTCSGTRPGDDFETIATTSGSPAAGVEIRIVGPDGSALPRGEVGEIVVRGNNVMQGYLDDPVATAETVDADGWLHTGDLGTMDDRDYLKIVGRLKDMLIVGGFNAYPAEIENIMLSHPAIAAVAVIGVADTRLGEVARAFVVPVSDSDTDEAEIIAWCRVHMANFKVPRSIRFLDRLPLNATGKVMKEELRRQP
ncbi:MAG: FadD3 family acyl-CoA ligase [Acidimicrobiaceae bacterium]|nr:FadD3 family acyl-CoA ligase [Acidimicrobiaceae bacterium]